MDRSFG